MNAEAPRSKVLPIVAALFPAVLVVLACPLTFALLPHSRIDYAMEEAGYAVYLVVAAAMFAVIVLAVLVLLAARGMRVPSAITIGVAALPWLVGILGAWSGLAIARSAVANADAGSRAIMMTRGIAEATNNRLFGAVLAAALLTAVALALAVGAIAQRAPGRAPIGAMIGAGAILPLAAIAGYAAIALELGAMFAIGFVVLTTILAVAIGAMAIGGDPHGRSGALGASATAAAGLAVCAVLTAATSATTMTVFGALANAAPDSRVALLAVGAAEMGPLTLASTLGLPLALAAALAVGGWAARRARPSVGRLIGAAAVALTAVVIVGVDAWFVSSTGSAVEELGAPAWARVDDFRPVGIPEGDEYPPDPSGLLRPGGLARIDGTALHGPMAGGLEALARDARSGAWDGETPEWLEDQEAATAPPDPFDAEPRVALVVDARVPNALLRALLAAAAERSMVAIAFVGADASFDEEAAASVIEAMPLAAAILRTTNGVTVRISIPRDVAAADPILFHGVIGARPLDTVRTRPGASVDENVLSLTRDAGYEDRYEHRPLYLSIAGEATVESVLVTAARAAARGFAPVLVDGPIPGEPTRAAP